MKKIIFWTMALLISASATLFSSCQYIDEWLHTFSSTSEQTECTTHVFGEWTITTPPTCSEDGEETRVCLTDSTHIETRTVDSEDHSYVKGKCEYCGEKELIPTEGLIYTLNDDGKSYSVTGIGTATDMDIVIASTYQGKPVTSIANGAFGGIYSGAPLTSIIIPDSVIFIGDNAFYFCFDLTSVTISDSVTSIGYMAFFGCNALMAITVNKNNSSYSSQDGVLFNKDKTELILYPHGKTDPSYTIPKGVTSIGDYAFPPGKSLTSIQFPDSITSIGKYAFNNCTGLTSIQLPDSVTSIGDHAFIWCTSLMSITIPESVTFMGHSAFANCSGLTNITISNGVTSIGFEAFWGCESLTSITIPNSITFIDDGTFGSCTSLKKVHINKNCSIAPTAFKNCHPDLEIIYYD